MNSIGGVIGTNHESPMRPGRRHVLPLKDGKQEVLVTPFASSINPSERVVLTPAEFAAFFGRHYTWAYRQKK